MKIGLMVYDDDTKTPLEEKVRRAAARFQQRTGYTPTACYVNPAMLSGAAVALEGIELHEARAVLLHHLWVGVEEN
jgi:hypothetical protein